MKIKKYILQRILTCIKYLITQNLPLHGHVKNVHGHVKNFPLPGHVKNLSLQVTF